MSEDKKDAVKEVLENTVEVGLPENQPELDQSPRDNTPDQEDEDPHLAFCASQPETDIGNRKRFSRRFGDIVAYISGAGWYVYDGKCWKYSDSESGEIRKLATEVAENIRHEINCIPLSDFQNKILQTALDAESRLKELEEKPLEDAEEMRAQMARIHQRIQAGEEIKKGLTGMRKARKSHFKSSCNTAKITNMQTEQKPYSSTDVEAFDANPLHLNVLNGTLHFTPDELDNPNPKGNVNWNSSLKPHDKDDKISKIIPVNYDPKAKAPHFNKFLEQSMPNEVERAFLQRLMGYAATGYTHEQIFAFFYGIGRNGKTTFLKAIRSALGDYSTLLNVDVLTGDDKKNGSGPTPELMHLKGARMVTTSEPDGGAKLKEGLVKLWTGDQEVIARAPFEKAMVEFKPKFTIFMDGNHKPKIINDDDGIWRRLLLVNWREQVAVEKVDKSLPQKLEQEKEGILAWIVEGIEEYLVYGLNVPESIKNEMKDHRDDSDHYGDFIRSAIDVTGFADDKEGVDDLYDAFVKHMNNNAREVHNKNTFSRRFAGQAARPWDSPEGKKILFTKGKSNGRTVYRGLKIKPEYTKMDDFNSNSY